jgi:hypothetical protein
MMPMEVAADLLDPEIGRLLRSDSVAEGGGE